MPRIETKKVGVYHVITSPDVPALYVAHRVLEAALALVPEQVEELARSAERRAARERVRRADGMAA